MSLEIKTLARLEEALEQGTEIRYEGKPFSPTGHLLGSSLSSVMLYIKAGKLSEESPAKVLDLGVLCMSKIDCEFLDSNTITSKILALGKLEHVSCKGLYKKYQGLNYHRCKPRMSPHIHFWGGSVTCPVPHGTEVKAYKRDGQTLQRIGSSLIWTDKGEGQDIVGFEVMGLAKGYKWPWE